MSVIEKLFPIAIVIVVLGFAAMIFELGLEPVLDYGDMQEKTGYVVDIDYSAGGYMTPCKTYVQWGDGIVTVLYGDEHNMRSGVNATLQWQEKRYYKHFVSFEVLE